MSPEELSRTVGVTRRVRSMRPRDRAKQKNRFQLNRRERGQLNEGGIRTANQRGLFLQPGTMLSLLHLENTPTFAKTQLTIRLSWGPSPDSPSQSSRHQPPLHQSPLPLFPCLLMLSLVRLCTFREKRSCPIYFMSPRPGITIGLMRRRKKKKANT